MNMPKPNQIPCIASVVIPVHAEGNILHRTMRALEHAVDYAKNKNDYDIEIVIVKDRVRDPATLDVLHHWEEKRQNIISVHNADFGSLSLSRNFGVSKASGTYISILDGDDLYSENWLNEAISSLEKGEGDIAHPQFVIGFPFDPYIKEMNVNPEHFSQLFEKNLWTALLMAPKSIFQEIPYVKDEMQFAYQDWLWNCQTFVKGYRHITINGTLVAIRQKPPGQSLWQRSFRLNKVVRPNELFRRIILHSAQSNSTIRRQAHPDTQLLNRALDWLNNLNPSYYQYLKAVKRKVIKTDIHHMSTRIKDQWTKLEMVEPELIACQTFRRIHEGSKLPIANKIQYNILKLLNNESIDLYFVKNENSFVTEPDDPELPYKFAIITNKKKRNTVRPGIHYILLQDLKLNMERSQYLILRILMETRINRLIVSGSDFAVRLLLKYHSVIVSNEKFIFIQTPDSYQNTRKIDDPYIVQAAGLFNFFDKIFLDCPDFAATIRETYGIPDEKITVTEKDTWIANSS